MRNCCDRVNTEMSRILLLILGQFLFSNAPAQTAFIGNAGADSSLLHTLQLTAAADAHRDIAAGKLIIKLYGLPDGWESDYAVLAKERYGITVQFVAGDVLTRQEYTYWSSYNRISEREIELRYGSFALDSLETEAQSLYKKKINLKLDLSSSDSDDEPYKIQVKNVPPFPDSLFVEGTFGSISLSIEVLKTGKLANVSLESVRFFQGPFTEDFFWAKPWPDSSRQDSVIELLNPWINNYISLMRVRLNSKHFYWLYQDTLHRSYTIEIRPQFEEQWPVKPILPKLIPPDSVVGLRERYGVYLSFWVNRSGEMVAKRIESLSLTVPTDSSMEDGLFSSYYCSQNREGKDTTMSLSGDVFLLERFKPWLETVIPVIKFDVDAKNEYFNYFDVASVLVYLGNQYEE
jgi:hypothetical protein